MDKITTKNRQFVNTPLSEEDNVHLDILVADAQERKPEMDVDRAKLMRSLLRRAWRQYAARQAKEAKL